MEVEGILCIHGRRWLDQSQRAKKVARQSLGGPSGEEGARITVDDDDGFSRFGDSDQFSDDIFLLLPVDMVDGVEADGAVEEVLFKWEVQEASMVKDPVVTDLFLGLGQGTCG